MASWIEEYAQRFSSRWLRCFTGPAGIDLILAALESLQTTRLRSLS